MSYSSRQVYPPEYDDPCICEICNKEVDNCRCPECPTCGMIGNPSCIMENHFSEETKEKKNDKSIS